MSNIYDVIIIGGGPGGLTAGIYTSRERLKTLLLEKELCGGLLAITDLIENYPGFADGIKGMDLIAKFKKQAEKFGTEIHEFEEVKKIELSPNGISIETNRGQYNTYTLILATGSVPKILNIPGESEFRGKGVSYCAICDGPLFREKKIAVIGGGDAAAQDALFLTRFADKVTLIHRRYELRATRILQERLRENKKIKLLLNYVPVSIEGKKIVDSIIVKNKESNEEKIIEVSGIFISVGFLPNSKFLEGLIKLDAAGYIKTNEQMETSTPGIYVAGDVRAKKVRQIAVACGEGTIAAISVRDYLKEIKR